MDLADIQSYLTTVEENDALHDAKQFDARMEVLDFIDHLVPDRLANLGKSVSHQDALILTKYKTDQIKAGLEATNVRLFQQLKADIRSRAWSGKEFISFIHDYTKVHAVAEREAPPGYDNLDNFVNGLLAHRAIPDETVALEAEMVYYQKTPARVVVEMVEKAQLRHDDVFFDLGAGPGQTAILVNLLAGIYCHGVEIEPAFCRYARDSARELNLSRVAFINADARKADYSSGTVFYLFTPFQGAILQDVMSMLEREALIRKIRIITYGPCSAKVALQPWLESEEKSCANIYKLYFFTSR